MQVRLKTGIIVLIAETEEEETALSGFAGDAADHVFELRAKTRKGLSLHDLGARRDACREPIDIVFVAGEERWRPISNLAETPFELHGRRYSSVEGFWQGLKFNSQDVRDRIAALHGLEAKRAGRSAPERDTIHYEGATIPVGRPPHWNLMMQACGAKFQQHAGARAALRASGDRPLTHRVKRDSRTIPSAVMADIWMRIRGRIQEKGDDPVTPLRRSRYPRRSGR